MRITATEYLRHSVESEPLPSHITLADAFLTTAATAPDTIAIVDGEQEFSWRQWHGQAQAVARGLQEEFGVRPGDVIAVILPNCVDFLVLHVAVAMAGGVFMPIHPDSSRADLASLLLRTTPRLVVLPATWPDTTGRAQGAALRTEVAGLGGLLIAGASAVEPDSLAGLTRRFVGRTPLPVDLTADAPFVLISSSGTTSTRPKICMHSQHRLLSNALTVIADGMTISPDDSVLSCGSFSFLFGMLSVHLSVLTGARQVLLRHWAARSMLPLLARTAPTLLYAVPTQLRDLIAEVDSGHCPRPPRLREIRTGGSRVPEDLVLALTPALADHVIVQWGMSELGAGMYTRPHDPVEPASRTAGRPVSGGHARVVNDEGRPCATGLTGYLEFIGPSLFHGYFDEPELTEQAFTEDGWLRTGDLASIDAFGAVAIEGRATGLINVGGRKVNTEEVERLLEDCRPLRDSVLVALSDHRLGEVPALLCTVDDNTDVTLDHILRHLQAKGVASYQLPTTVRVVDELPRTPTGKIARHRAQELARSLVAGNLPPQRRPSEPTEVAAAVALVCELTAEIAGRTVRQDDTFKNVGLDSASGVRLRLALTSATGLDLPASLIFDCPTPAAVALLLTGQRLPSRAAVQADPQAGHGIDDEPLAIVGIGCRLPGGIGTPDQLWSLLADGREVRSELPTDRGWPIDQLYSPEPAATGTIGCRHGGFLSGIGEFDAKFFAIDTREARSMDPQQRLLLETAWEALERSGITAQSLRDSDASVFVGMMSSDYVPRWFESPQSYDGTVGIGTAASVASGRLAYLLGLHGTALTVDTACSSSLVALHLAGQALRRRETSVAIVAGVTVMSSPANLVEFSRMNLLAPDGRCKAFADGADGVGLSEGAGVLVLQRLSDAQAQGRQVLSVIRGSAVVQDGASNGLTAPNGRAQEMAIARALRAAKVDPIDIDVVEAHGTGTPLGDEIELRALQSAYGTPRPPGRPLWLGSVKSNLGHTQAAAGIISVIKMVLGLAHATLPKTLHADQPRPDLDSSGLRLLTETVAWPRSDRKRMAAVSSFGISGTNVHVVLEESPVAKTRTAYGAAAASAPWLLSARNSDTLPVLAAGIVGAVTETGTTAAEVANVLATGRSPLRHRTAILPDDNGDHLPGLRSVAGGTPSADVVTGTALDGSTAFVFPGHGTQWTAMAGQLLAESPVFADAIAECEAALAVYLPWSLTSVLQGTPAAPSLARPSVAQPATFAVMVALAALWRSHGVQPDVVVGHSQGAIAAAYVAGGLSLPDAARIITARGQVLDRILGKGAMAAIAMDRTEVQSWLAPWRDAVCLAVVNGPRSVVVSGQQDAITALLGQARRDGHRATQLIGDVAFHSPQIEDLASDFTAMIVGIQPRPSAVAFVCGSTGNTWPTEQLTPDYWRRNLRDPVDFHAATTALLGQGHRLFVEVGAHPVLSQAVEETVGEADVSAKVVGSIRRDDGGLRRFLRSLAEAHVYGAAVDWAPVFDGRHADAAMLPTYPFQRKHFWLATDTGAGGRAATTAPESDQADDTGTLTVLARPAAPRGADLLDLVRGTIASVMNLAGPHAVLPDADFEAFGLSSLAAVEVRNVLAGTLNASLPATIVLDHRTADQLAGYLTNYLEQQEPAQQEPARPDDVEPASASASELPGGFESMYRRLCQRGQAEAGWDMVHAAATLRSQFRADDDLSAMPLAGFRQVVGRLQPTLVCVPSVVSLAGRAEYKKFAAPFSGMRDVIQLGEPGFRDGETLPADIDALVAAYLEVIRRRVDTDPIVLCGRSFGGWIAHAMACRLADLGKPPVGIVLVDTFWPSEEFVRKFIPRTLRRLADRQEELGTELGMTRLTAIGWYLRMLAGWQPRSNAVPTLYLLPDDQTSIEQHLRSGGWRLPHTELSVPTDHFGIMDGDAPVAAAAVEEWLSTITAETELS